MTPIGLVPPLLAEYLADLAVSGILWAKEVGPPGLQANPHLAKTSPLRTVIVLNATRVNCH